MGRYIARRVGSGVVTLFLFITLLFFLINAVVPGDFVTSLGPMTAEQAAAVRSDLGLDRPLHEQYFDWLGGLVTLDLGNSFGGAPVADLLRQVMASTIVVLSVGVALAFVLGGWLGRSAGYTSSRFKAGSLTFVAILCLTVFPPALAVAMEQGVKSFTGWRGLGEFGTLDAEQWVDFTPSELLWRVFLIYVLSVLVLWAVDVVFFRLTRRRLSRWVFLGAMVGLPLLVWAQMGIASHVMDVAGAMALLLLAVVILTFGEVVLVTRASMDDVMREDYVMVARAKGLPERQVRDRHAARAALLPVLSRFTVAIPYFLTGLVILEVVFAGSHASIGIPIAGALERVAAPPGLGSLLFDAVADQNTPVIAGSLLVVGVLTLGLRVALDVAHASLDPRIRFSGPSNGR